MKRQVVVGGLNGDVVAGVEKFSVSISAGGAVLASKVFAPAGVKATSVAVDVDIPSEIGSVDVTISGDSIEPALFADVVVPKLAALVADTTTVAVKPASV